MRRAHQGQQGGHRRAHGGWETLWNGKEEKLDLFPWLCSTPLCCSQYSRRRCWCDEWIRPFVFYPTDMKIHTYTHTLRVRGSNLTNGCLSQFKAKSPSMNALQTASLAGPVREDWAVWHHVTSAHCFQLTSLGGIGQMTSCCGPSVDIFYLSCECPLFFIGGCFHVIPGGCRHSPRRQQTEPFITHYSDTELLLPCENCQMCFLFFTLNYAYHRCIALQHNYAFLCFLGKMTPTGIVLIQH